MNLLRRFAKNSFFLISSRITDIIGVIVTTPIVARYLGLKSFGDYALVIAFAVFIKPLADFGFEQITCRDVAKAKDKEAANKIINSAIIVRVILSVSLILLAYLLVELIPSGRELKIAILVSIITEIMISFATIFFAVFKAYEKMEYELICSFVHRITSVVAILIVVLFDLGFLSLFYARLFSAFIFLIITIFFAYRKFIILSWRFSWKIAKFMFKEAYPLAIYTVLLVASFKIDVFFLKYFRSSSEVALFEAPHRLIMQLQFIPMSVTFAVFPFLTHISEKSTKSLRMYYEKIIKFFYIFAVFPVVLMVVGSGEIIGLLFGEKFLPAAVSLKVLAGTFIFLVMVALQHNILVILGKQKLSIICVAACLLSNTLLDFAIIPRYGYIGASIATFVSYFIFFALTSLFVSLNVGKINIAKILVKPSIAVLLAGIAFHFILNKTIASLFIAFASGIPLYLITMLILKTFSADEIEAVKGILHKKKREIVREGNE